MTKRPVCSLLPLLALALLLSGCGDDEKTAASHPWAGKTFLLEIPQERWSDPPQIGEEIGRFVPQFLISVEGGSGDTLNMAVGTANGGVQQMCNPTTEIEVDGSGYPEVQIGPSEFPIYLRNEEEDITVNATVHDFTLTNVLPEGDVPTDDGDLSAVMDVRELYPMFYQIIAPSPDSVCTAMAGTADCEPCPQDGEIYCLTIQAMYIGASELADFTLEPIQAGSVDDPACADTET